MPVRLVKMIEEPRPSGQGRDQTQSDAEFDAALARSWQRLTPRQQQEFQTALTKIETK